MTFRIHFTRDPQFGFHLLSIFTPQALCLWCFRVLYFQPATQRPTLWFLQIFDHLCWPQRGQASGFVYTSYGLAKKRSSLLQFQNICCLSEQNQSFCGANLDRFTTKPKPNDIPSSNSLRSSEETGSKRSVHIYLGSKTTFLYRKGCRTCWRKEWCESLTNSYPTLLDLSVQPNLRFLERYFPVFRSALDLAAALQIVILANALKGTVRKALLGRIWEALERSEVLEKLWKWSGTRAPPCGGACSRELHIQALGWNSGSQKAKLSPWNLGRLGNCPFHGFQSGQMQSSSDFTGVTNAKPRIVRKVGVSFMKIVPMIRSVFQGIRQAALFFCGAR